MKIIAQTETGFLLSATNQELLDLSRTGRVSTQPVAAPAIGQSIDAVDRLHSLAERLDQSETALRHARRTIEETATSLPLEGRGKTDLEIVNEVNGIARTILSHSGYETDETVQFWNHPSPRCKKAWATAVEVYEALTGTEVHDAVLSVMDDEEEAA